MDYLENSIEIKNWWKIPNHPNYEISDSGEVRDIFTKSSLRSYPSNSGSRYYITCAIGRIHRLLGSAVLGRILSRNEFVCHINGNSYDNRAENLIVASPLQNSRDRVEHNTNGRKLRNQDVRDLRILSRSKTRSWLAAKYGISISHVCAILTGRSWKNLPC